MAEHIFEGTWGEVAPKFQALTLADDQQVRIVVEDNGHDSSRPEVQQGQMIWRGMFPQLLGLTDEDFAAAEFHGDPDDGLDWS